MKRTIAIKILMFGFCISSFSQSNYYMNKAKDCMREAELYTKKKRTAYYSNKAQDYLREADYSSKYQNEIKARNYIRWANEAAD